VEVAHGDGDRRVGVEGQRPRQHLEGDDAGRVDVGGGRRHQAAGLLGAEIVDGAESRPDLGQVGVGEALGDAEVDDDRVAVRVDQDVLGLDVAVDVAALVGVVEGGAELLEEARRRRPGGRGPRSR
jgi:hypothetical protein